MDKVIYLFSTHIDQSFKLVTIIVISRLVYYSIISSLGVSAKLNVMWRFNDCVGKLVRYKQSLWKTIRQTSCKTNERWMKTCVNGIKISKV